jgi:hypothetical protein
MTRTAEPPLGQFEERLLAELKHAMATRPEPAPAPLRPRTPRRRRARLLAATAIGAAAAVAAGLLLAAPGQRAATPSAGYTLDSFLTAAAAAARTQDTSLPAPDQAFYIKDFVTSRSGTSVTQGCIVTWNLYPLTGRGIGITSLSRTACSSPQQSLDHLVRLMAHLPRLSDRHYYPALGSLPDTPAALRSALYAAATLGPAYWEMPSSSTANEIVLTLLGRLLEAPLPGSLRAAVYQVIAEVPGVTLVSHATDAIGRPGVGIQMTLPPVGGGKRTVELIIARGTYHFLGIDSDFPEVQGQQADIGSGLVTRPAS